MQIVPFQPRFQADQITRTEIPSVNDSEGNSYSPPPSSVGLNPAVFRANFLKFAAASHGDKKTSDKNNSKINKNNYKAKWDEIKPKNLDNYLKKSPIVRSWYLKNQEQVKTPAKAGGDKNTGLALPGGLATMLSLGAGSALGALEDNPGIIERDINDKRNTKPEKAALQTIEAFLPDWQTLSLGTVRLYLETFGRQLQQIDTPLNKLIADKPEAYFQELKQAYDIQEGFLRSQMESQGDFSPRAFLEYIQQQAFQKEPGSPNTLQEITKILNKKVDTTRPMTSRQIERNLPDLGLLAEFFGSNEVPDESELDEDTDFEEFSTAVDIAKSANSDQVEPKHLLLALLRATGAMMDSAPQYINASPDAVPLWASEFPHFPAHKGRLALDAILPPELRKGLSGAQITALIKQAEKDVEKLVYPNGIRIHENNDYLKPKPSKLMSHLFTQLVYNTKVRHGDYLYTFVEIMKNRLPQTAEDIDSQKLGKLLENTWNTAANQSANIPKVTFDMIGGYPGVKAELKLFADLKKGTEMVDALGVKPEDFGILPDDMEKGILLYGPPGTGKTYMAKALANYMKVPFFYYSGDELISKWVGDSAKNVHNLFAEARGYDKAFIFIDEADGILSKRSESNEDGNGETNSAVNAILTELDGLANNSGVTIVAATNRKEKLDEAALRSGRLGKHIEVGMPNQVDCEEILKIHTKGKPLADDVDIKTLARLYRDCSPATLKGMCVGAAVEAFKDYLAGRNPERKIYKRHFDEAFDVQAWGVKQENMVYDPFTRDLTIHHEAVGHGLIADAFGWDHRTLTTIGRNGSMGHYSSIAPEGDRGRTTQYYLQDLLVTLGGRAAEELAAGELNITDGVSQDFKQSREVLLHLISNGIILSRSANHYGSSCNPVTREDQVLINRLLSSAYKTVKAMISELPVEKRKAMAAALNTETGIEYRNEDVTNFYRRFVTEEERARIREVGDEFIRKVVKVWNLESDAQVTRLFEPKRQESKRRKSSSATR